MVVLEKIQSRKEVLDLQDLQELMGMSIVECAEYYKAHNIKFEDAAEAMKIAMESINIDRVIDYMDYIIFSLTKIDKDLDLELAGLGVDKCIPE